MLTKAELEDIEQYLKTLNIKHKSHVYYVQIESCGAYLSSSIRLAILMLFFSMAALYLAPLYLLDLSFLQAPYWMATIPTLFFLLGYMLGQFKKIKKFLTSKSEMKEKFNHKVSSIFVQNFLDDYNHQSIYIFVSKFEKSVQIIAGKDINAQVSKKHWNTLLGEYIKALKNKNIGAKEATKQLIDAVAQTTLDTKVNPQEDYSPPPKTLLEDKSSKPETDTDTTEQKEAKEVQEETKEVQAKSRVFKDL